MVNHKKHLEGIIKMDIFEKCITNPTAIRAKQAIEAGYHPYFHTLDSKQNTEVIIDGRSILMMGSNNYLGLTVDQRVIDAAKAAIDKFGSGCTGSRFLNGTLTLHEELERNLADFIGKEEALTFSTGFQTNLGIITAIAGRGDYLICDNENHASLVDAQRLSFARVLKYEHSDMEDLENKLSLVPDYCGKLIVTDGVFSMGGDLCNLPEIVRLKKKYGARLMVDEAHDFGMLGKTGRGVIEHFDLADDVDIVMSTFSKSMASLGGFAASTKEVIHYLKHLSRPFIFSASIPPSNCATVIKALEILIAEPERLIRLGENAHYMQEGFKSLGLETIDSPSAIVPVMTYEMERTFAITKALFDAGVYINPVVPPGVKDGQCLLRTSYTATHTKDQLDRALDIFKKVFAQFQ
jgi:8-amino-7-oxononanoate synthase